MNRPRLVIILFLCGFLHLSGQDLSEKDFDHYTKADGMSHNSISAITQDSAGYLWIATFSGLNRYNGSRFVQFHSNNDSLSLASEDLAGLSWLDKDRLAIFTAGLHIINTKNGETRNLFIPYHDLQYQYKFNMIDKAVGDDKGNIYLLSRSGFYQFDKDYKLVFRFDYFSEEEVPITHFYFGEGLLDLDGRRLVIVSRGGLFLYDKEKRQIKKMESGDCPIMAEFLNYPSVLYSFFQRKPGEFFILKTDSDSIFYINAKENKKVVSKQPIPILRTEFMYRSKMISISDTVYFITGHNSGFFKMNFSPKSGVARIDPKKYFPSYLCTGLLKDRDNNIWVATEKGLFRQNLRRAQVETAYLPQDFEKRFPGILIKQTYVDKDKIYVGTFLYGAVFLYDKKNMQFVRSFTFDQFKKKTKQSFSVYSFAEIDSSNLLIATSGPLIILNKKTNKERILLPPNWNLQTDWTNELCKDSKSRIWISSSYIYLYDPKSRSFSVIPKEQQLISRLDMPTAIREDSKGNIWMAGHGMSRYNTTLNNFDLVLSSFPFIKMPDKQVSALVVDKEEGNIWFNSHDNGLIAYDMNKGTFRHFTTNSGLPDNNITSLFINGRKLWMAGRSGIACMDLRTFQVVSFGKEDGFPDMPVIDRANFVYDNASKQLYLGFFNSLVRFNPENILRKKTAPQLFIEEVTINGQKSRFLPGATITTSWRNSEIRLTIGTINFSDGNSQGYACRILKDNQTPWQQLGSQPSFNIYNLSPGTHRIQVKVFSLNNYWPEQIKEISVVVMPPFWKKDWFIIAVDAVVLVFIYMLIRWRTGLARNKEMEKTRIQKLIADDYKNQFELEQISNYFSSSLAGKDTEEEVLWDVTHNLIGRMNYEDCIIYLWNEDKTKMIQKAAYGPKGHPEFIMAQQFDVLPGQGIVGHVIETRQPVLVNDTRSDNRYRIDDAFRLSELCVPIIHNDELLGVLDSEHHQPNYFSERDLKIMTTIATLIGNKLKQIESEKSLEAKRKELANINEQLAEARLSALQAQMNPHFVFNALNSIKRMILEGDNEKASRYLSKFALMIRMTLNHSKDIFVTLDENIEYLKAYLEMEQLRFDESFVYNIVTDEKIDGEETYFPSLMIQPLVENAIWHGLMQSGRNKKILIRFMQDQNTITCIIEDNGIGIHESLKQKEKNSSFHHSLGLENMRKRIKIMNEKYDTDCTLEIIDLKDVDLEMSGTRVTLKFNLIIT